MSESGRRFELTSKALTVLAMTVVLHGCGGGGDSASTPTATLPNHAPTIGGTPGASARVGTAYGFTPSASDSDGDALTFSIANKPGWASFNASTGALSGTPAAGDVGNTSSITISVSDGKMSASLTAFTIAVAAQPAQNSPPTITGTPGATVVAGQSYTFTPTASDPNQDTLTFTISNKPSWATFSTSNGRLSGTPTASDVGTYANILIGTTDGTASAALPAFSIAVNQVALGSATVSWTPPTTNTDGSALTNLAGYRIYYGTSASSLSSMVEAGVGVTSMAVSNLSPSTWYFAVRAFTSTGLESDSSQLATKTVQ